MRNVLNALADELQRLRAAGVRTVPVTDESMDALRTLVRRQAGDRRPETVERSWRRETGGRRPEASPRPALIRTNRLWLPLLDPASHLRSPASGLRPPTSTLRAPGPTLTPPVVVLPDGDKAARWRALREQVLNDPVCRAHAGPGKQVVFGVGSVDAAIMFVGEAPGAEEEDQGEPFVGPAGQLLTRMIKAMGVERADVYIGNIMNWRPELSRRPDGTQVGNREPTPEETAFCLPFIAAQIEIIEPRVIVALGATAARGLLGARAIRTLGEARGRWHEWRGRPVRVTYHPSYLLRKAAEGRDGRDARQADGVGGLPRGHGARRAVDFRKTTRLFHLMKIKPLWLVLAAALAGAGGVGGEGHAVRLGDAAVRGEAPGGAALSAAPERGAEIPPRPHLRRTPADPLQSGPHVVAPRPAPVPAAVLSPRLHLQPSRAAV